MTAKEAHQIARDKNTGTSEGQLKKIFGMVEEAAKEGLYSISISEMPHRDVVKCLVEKGYTVRQEEDPGECKVRVTVSW